MTQVPLAPRFRLSAVALVVAGIFFVVYPALRPFSDEASLEGALAFASARWLAAHMLAMVAFTLVGLGMLGLHASLRSAVAERLGYRALVLGLVGIGLTLPFYGGEAYGLHAIGREAVRQGAASLLGLAATVRSGAGLVFFLVGLLLLAAAAVTVAAAVWRSGTYSKWSGVPFAVGFALYIPQFFWTQPVRVAHGVLVAIGCLWIAGGLWRRSKEP